MLADKPTDQPLAVYLNLRSSDSRNEARKTSVQRYFDNVGLAKDQVDLKMGPNPDSSSSASTAAANLKKLEEASKQAETGAGSGDSGGMSTGTSQQPSTTK
jgi:hypothetical protein